QWSNTHMRATGWSNGSPSRSGAGLGVKINKADRDLFFRREWSEIAVRLPSGHTVTVTIAPSFWRNCSELRSAAIGSWLIDEGLYPWVTGSPPALSLELVAPS